MLFFCGDGGHVIIISNEADWLVAILVDDME